MPLIELDLHRFQKDGGYSVSLQLTPSEARTLARQLVHLADPHTEENYCVQSI